MTPSLSSFIFSLSAGAFVLAAIFGALATVSSQDRISRD
ncbi:photosystem II reaction center X protein (chloroplast) [Aureococcus anophagefferens]|jgi:hypothetical protein|uniref:Photosystem II reaction center protein X n=1 Tax=Aureococcus anophagefferens TaxID=44056 RepID=C6KIN6_AURAN|nr:photosystem II protein X [Aureococcus anophagefferens]ACS36842.1 photosystem II protein X [Aureococcus anophagefferens]KAH8043010.1 photosystem II reaction center X protein [Aureococcus anophagefferens]KAH8043109.1 photosystem II reaction center X protein [Aureococcus anophagefferens]KAH8043312.1 photosystem II reaction center X protein [Aureococcus anophagefferens]